MRYISTANPFQIKDQFPGATPWVRRALAQVNIESANMKKMLAVMKAVGIKYQSPFWLPGKDIWAQIAFPQHKLALYLCGFGARARVDAMRERFLDVGWQMMDITTNSIERTPTAVLVEHLQNAVKELKK